MHSQLHRLILLINHGFLRIDKLLERRDVSFKLGLYKKKSIDYANF